MSRVETDVFDFFATDAPEGCSCDAEPLQDTSTSRWYLANSSRIAFGSNSNETRCSSPSEKASSRSMPPRGRAVSGSNSGLPFIHGPDTDVLPDRIYSRLWLCRIGLSNPAHYRLASQGPFSNPRHLRQAPRPPKRNPRHCRHECLFVKRSSPSEHQDRPHRYRRRPLLAASCVGRSLRSLPVAISANREPKWNKIFTMSNSSSRSSYSSFSSTSSKPPANAPHLSGVGQCQIRMLP